MGNYKTNLSDQTSLGLTADHRLNVLKTFALHRDAEVVYYDDYHCRDVIRRVHSEEMARYFDTESYGAYKSDVCRYAMLYELGGYYFDNDIEMMGNILDLVPANATI